MDVHKFPFLSLLERLRNERGGGFSISIEDYRDIVAALSSGYGGDSIVSLRQTLKALLVKHRSQEQLFERSFRAAADEYYAMEIRLTSGRVVAAAGAEQFSAGADEPAPPGQPDGEKKYATLNEKTKRAGFTRLLASVRRLLKALRSLFQNAKQASRRSDLVESDDLEDNAVPIHLAGEVAGTNVTPEYQPASERQIRQCFRLLRKEQQRVASIREIDVDATVRGIAEDGMFLKVVYARSTLNTTRLVWFIDTSHSMRSLERYTKRVLNSLDASLRRQSFYFDNAPRGMYFADASHVDAVDPRRAYDCINPTAMSIVISDAGALRGTFCRDRVQASREAIRQIGGRSPHVIWLNPLPRARWVGTSAEEIARDVPMFSLALQDVVLGVNALRVR